MRIFHYWPTFPRKGINYYVNKKQTKWLSIGHPSPGNKCRFHTPAPVSFESKHIICDLKPRDLKLTCQGKNAFLTWVSTLKPITQSTKWMWCFMAKAVRGSTLSSRPSYMVRVTIPWSPEPSRPHRAPARPWREACKHCLVSSAAILVLSVLSPKPAKLFFQRFHSLPSVQLLII